MMLITSSELNREKFTTIRRYGLWGDEFYDADQVDHLLDEMVIPTLRAHEDELLKLFVKGSK